MSGGSHNYIYQQIDQELVGAMRDVELDDLMKDISGLAYALEWYDSGDTSKEDYLAEVKVFKAKWFESSREERLKQYVNDKLEDLHKEIFSLIGADPAPPKKKEAVDVAPVRYGRWIATNDENKKRCSECGVIHLIAQYPYGEANYCPNCGTEMEFEGEAMTNAQKLEKLGMYVVLIRIAEATDMCMIDMLQRNGHKCPPHKCPPGQDCSKCIGKWLGEKAEE